MVRFCVHRPDLRCYHDGMCSSLDMRGNVVFCSLLPNPSGRLVRRKVGFSPVSIHKLLKGGAKG
jgi:hypothetical protein